MTMHYRYDEIQKPCDKTLQWFFDNQPLAFEEQLETRHGTYWVNEKPGCLPRILLRVSYLFANIHSDGMIEMLGRRVILGQSQRLSKF